MNGSDTYLDVNNSHLRVTSGNVYASSFNLDQISIVSSANTATTVNFNNDTKAFNTVSNIEVGTANLFVNTTTSRVGIGTNAPTHTLDVHGTANVGTITTTDINVTGNLTVLGTTTTLDTVNLSVKDPIIEIGKDNTASPVVDLGLILTRPATTSNVGIIFDENTDTLEIGYTQSNATDTDITMRTAATEPLSVNVNGTISGNGSGLTALNATNVTTGTLTAARIPDLDAAKITTGTLPDARIPNLNTSKLTAGTLADARIPNLNTSKLTAGTLPVSRGGTGTTTSTGTGSVVLSATPAFTGDVTFDTDTLKIDATNNRVGIGTTNPQGKLFISADFDHTLDRPVNDKNHYLVLEKTGNKVFGTGPGISFVGSYYTSADYENNYAVIKGVPDLTSGEGTHGRLEFYTNSGTGTDADKLCMAINHAGNVGIGTTTPRTNLHIGQQLNSQGDKNTIPSAGLGLSAVFPSSTHAWFANRVNATGDEYWGLAVGTIYDGSSYLQSLNKNTGTYYDILLQPNGGNVGIGVTNPLEKLDVRGTIIAPIVSYSSNQDAAYLIAGTPNYTGATTSWDTHGFQHRIKSNSGGTPRITIDAPSGGEVFTIVNGGNVGIGKTGPLAKLHIKSSSGGDGIAIFHPSGGTGGTLNLSGGVRGGILISNGGGGSNGSDDYSSQPIVLTGGGTGATDGNIRGGSIWSMWGGSQYGLAFKGASNGESVPAGGTTPNLFISSNKVGIGTTAPTYTLYVNGSLFYSSGGLNGSDDRIKYNEENITNALDIICKLKPQKYEKIMAFPSDAKGSWIPTDENWETVKNAETKPWEGFTHGDEYGFIAQDVRNIPEVSFLVSGSEMKTVDESVSPEEYVNLNEDEQGTYTRKYLYEENVITIEEYTNLISENKDKCTGIYIKQVETQTPLGLNYQGIFVVAVKAIQEIDAQLQAEKAEVTTLKSQLASVLTRLDALENA